MNKFQTFQEYLSTQSSQAPVLGFAFNIFVAAILGFILSTGTPYSTGRNGSSGRLHRKEVSIQVDKEFKIC